MLMSLCNKTRVFLNIFIILNELKLMLIFREPSLLCPAGRASCFIVFMKVLLQTNDIEALSRLITLESRIFSHLHSASTTLSTEG